MASVCIRSAIGYAFDVLSIVISLLDLSTDIYILIQWNLDENMEFFWIGLSVLILAQMSYVIMFYISHEPRGACEFIITLLCTCWCIPIYSILFYFASDEHSILRKWTYLRWNTYTDNPKHSPTMQMLARKMYKNRGFIMEAMIEALPMSILQLSYMVLYKKASVIAIASILISMLSVCSKLFLMMSQIDDSKSWTNKILMWFSFVVDFIGIFFIVAFAFGDSELFQNVMIWEFIICVAPCTVLLGIAMAPGVSYEISKYCCCCLFPLLFAIFSFGWLLSLTIASAAWFVLLFLNHGSVYRIKFRQYDSWESGRDFYEKMYQWVLEGAHDVVDVEDNQIVIPKHRDRILRVCILNKELMDKFIVQRFTISVKNRDETFMRYLTAESKTNFVNVTWRGIRDHHVHGRYNGFGERNAQFMRALFYNFYADIFYDLLKSRGDWSESLVFGLSIPLTFLFGPFYVISRAFHLILPVVTPLILDWNSWDSFQFLIWGTYSCFMVIWCCGVILVCRREFYLWHILPTVNRLKDFKVSCSFDEVSTAISAEYDRVTARPIIRKMLMKRYGVDVSDIIMMYLLCITVTDDTESEGLQVMPSQS